MSPPTPFIDQETSTLDTGQIRAEAYPLAGLIMLFGGWALVPFLFALFFAGNSALSVFFTIIAQFVLAIGTGIVLVYVIARGIQLTDG